MSNYLVLEDGELRQWTDSNEEELVKDHDLMLGIENGYITLIRYNATAGTFEEAEVDISRDSEDDPDEITDAKIERWRTL